MTSAVVQALIVHTTLLVDGREVSLDKREKRFFFVIRNGLDENEERQMRVLKQIGLSRNQMRSARELGKIGYEHGKVNSNDAVFMSDKNGH